MVGAMVVAVVVAVVMVVVVLVFMAVASGIDEHHEELKHDIMNYIAPIDAKTKDQERAKHMALPTRRKETSRCNNRCRLRLQGNKR